MVSNIFHKETALRHRTEQTYESLRVKDVKQGKCVKNFHF